MIILSTTDDKESWLPYCSALLKNINSTIADANITTFIGTLADAIKFTKGFSDYILLRITDELTTNYDLIDGNYPDLQIAMPLVASTIGNFFPTTISLSPFNSHQACLTATSGVGLTSKFLTGSALEFIEDVSNIDITDCKNVFSVNTVSKPSTTEARFHVTDINFIKYLRQGQLITVTGVTGFQFNPNGEFRIVSIDTIAENNYSVKVTHTLGTGAYASGGTIKFNTWFAGVVIAVAKILQIKQELDISWQEARFRAQMTGRDGVWDTTSGYGSVNVNKAVGFLTYPKQTYND